MTPFEKLIEKIGHRKWRVTNQNTIRDTDSNCPLDALVKELGNYGGCSNAYGAIGGSQRQAWIIMSAADNRITDPFSDDGTFSPLKRSEIKAMRDRLTGVLVAKLEAT